MAAAGAFAFAGGFAGNIAGEETASLINTGKFTEIDGAMQLRSITTGVINMVSFGFSGLFEYALNGLKNFNLSGKLSSIAKSAWHNLKDLSFKFSRMVHSFGDIVGSFFASIHFSFHGSLLTTQKSASPRSSTRRR